MGNARHTTRAWLSLFLSATVATAAPTSTVVVPTPDGSFRADRVVGPSGDKWIRARGIQYAEHPVRALRWQPPLPKKRVGATGEVVDARAFGRDCINAPELVRLVMLGLNSTQGEACLYLNVWAPEGAAEDMLL